MSIWQKTPTPNLFRYLPSGTYFLRARIGKNHSVRQSLRTDNYAMARTRLGIRLAELRAARPQRGADTPTTLWEAIQVVRAQIEADPALKTDSRSSYVNALKSLGPGMPAAVPTTQLGRLGPGEMEAWWKRTATHYAPARANYLLLFVRRALKAARESSAMTRDPAESLRTVPIPRTRLPLISSEQFAVLIAATRGISPAAADWVEFVAYTGCRPEEANAVQWSHVDRAANVVQIVGGKEGTKNRETRRVPITSRLAELLDRLERQRTGQRVLAIRDVRTSLHKACDALGIPRMRRYDFRHLFATRCVESGVDIPSVAKWLGHKDGGALAMKTYVHPHNEHEQRAAAKVVF